jgi:hemolysin III
LKKEHRQQSYKEEIYNALSHGLGAIFGVVAILLFFVSVSQPFFSVKVLSCLVYAMTLTIMYVCSFLYHTAKNTERKRVLKIWDHSSIYLLIAGTYTPFLLVDMGGSWGWSMFAVVWTLALLGIIFKFFYSQKFKNLSVAIYLAMGWLILIAIKPLILDVPKGGIILLVIGGLFYSFGTIFYLLDKRYYYFHFLWHICVLLGSIFQFFAVFYYVA